MTKDFDKSEILTRFLRVATRKWGAERVEEIRPSLEKAAEAIWKVENFDLMPEEEPALITAILEQSRRERKEK